MLTSDDIRTRHLDFFRQRGHAIIPGGSLIPPDRTVLFTSAGIQPLVPYFGGTPHPAGRRLADYQRCLRTSDIEEVGDPGHLTCFEMLGNWSLGDYYKRESLGWTLELLTDVLGLDRERLCVTVFAGDQESHDRWRELGIDRIHVFGREQNWWGPPGPHGPCGPDSEVFFWTGEGEPVGDPESDPRWLEVGNNVFIGFDQAPDGTLRELPQHNVDVGLGLERMTCLLQGVESVYDTDLFVPIRDHVRTLASSRDTRAERIVCDHVRSGVLLAGDGVRPSNTDQGYVLRRLLRRAVRQGRVLGIEDELLRPLGETVIERYAGIYPHLGPEILDTLAEEERRFARTLRRGLREIERLLRRGTPITGAVLFRLFETHGLPVELSVEELGGVDGWREGFEASAREHRERSRAGAETRFA
jgi:alanyl-tRNA synthetase